MAALDAFGASDDQMGVKCGRKRKPGRRVFVGLFLREGEDDKTIERLAQLPRGQRSSYIRRVLRECRWRHTTAR